jgi:methylase of polypeptide subunit release factors
MFEQAGFSSIQITNDYAGHERVVSGRVSNRG